MAMDCGHFESSVETQKDRLLAGVCPVCNVPTASQTTTIPHEYCICCEERWALENDKIVNVIHI